MIKPVSLLSHIRTPFGRKEDTVTSEEIGRAHVEKITSGDTNLLVIFHPNEKTLDCLQKNYHLHPIHLDDLVSPLQRPKVDYAEEYIYFVVHFPEHHESLQKIGFAEVDFILTQKDVIVIPEKHFQPLEEVLALLEKDTKLRKAFFSKGAGFLLYNLIDRMVDSIFPLVGRMEKEVEIIDNNVFTEKARAVIEKISYLRRNAIFFQTIIKPELAYFTAIKDKNHPLLSKEIKTYFTNISDHMIKIWDRLEDVRELIDNLSTTFESYFSFKTNETIKVLTIFSVTLMPLTLLSSIYGMNLSFLPFADHPMALFILSTFMTGIVIAMYLVFKIKKWM